MASSQSGGETVPRAEKRGGRYCVAGTENNESCRNTSYTPGIKMHQFPSDPVTRKKWIEFVRRHRPTFPDDPKPSASLCSAHFEDVCYARNPFVQIPGMENIKFNKTLIRGALPTRDTVFPSGPPALTTRSKRRVSSTKSQSSSDCLACEGTYPDCWRVLYSNFMVYTGW